MPLLVPGVGAQGGDAGAVVSNAKTPDGTGLMVSSSRAVLYASRDDDYAAAAARAARELRDAINAHR
jgi:orotidine-5'-phosphate decarboxylase